MARLYESFIGGSISDDPLTAAATTLNSAALASMQAVASPDHMIIAIDPDGYGGDPEYVKVTAHTASSTSATVVRGVLGTSARQHEDETAWVAPALHQGQDGLTFIEEVDLTSDTATISFSGIPDTFRDLVVIGMLRSDNANYIDNGLLQVGNGTVDTGSNYRYYLTITRQASTPTLEGVSSEGSTSMTLFVVPGASADSAIFANINLEILRYTETAHNRHLQCQSGHVGDLAASSRSRQGFANGVWEDITNEIDIITFSPSGGSNWVADSYLTLYGRSYI